MFHPVDVSWIQGILSKLTLKTEAHIESAHLATNPQKQNDLAASMVQLNYDLYKGISPFIVAENLQTDMSQSQTAQSSHGLGIKR